MIVGFSKHGKGSAQSAINYFLARSGTDGEERDPVPVILAGDPALIARTAEASPHKWKYTSGVLSWAPGEEISEEIEQELIQSFEDYAFAGIDPENRPPVLWVRHLHAGHHEMHFVSPRSLNDGRSYNMRPPEDEKRWDSFRAYFNAREGWADPEDPGRARLISLPDWIEKARRCGRGSPETIQETITDWVEQRVRFGITSNRDDLINQFKEQGYDLARKSKNYISIKPPGGGRNIRLKGIFYEESFNIAKIMAEPNKSREPTIRKVSERELGELQRLYDRAQSQRSDGNKRRYGRNFNRNSQTLETKKKDYESESYQTGALGDCVVRHFGVGGVSRKQNVERSNKAGDRSTSDVQGGNLGIRGEGLGANRTFTTSTIQEQTGVLVTGREEVENERNYASRERVNKVREDVAQHLRKSAGRSRETDQEFEEINRIRRQRYADLKAANKAALWLYERFIQRIRAIKERLMKRKKSALRTRGYER